MEIQQLFQIWLHERQTFFTRWSVYLIANSLLFLGFIEVVDIWLGLLAASLGLVGSIAIGLDLWVVVERIGQLEKKLNLQDLYKRKWLTRRNGQILLSALLFVFWVLLLLYSVGQVN